MADATDLKLAYDEQTAHLGKAKVDANTMKAQFDKASSFLSALAMHAAHCLPLATQCAPAWCFGAQPSCPVAGLVDWGCSHSRCGSCMLKPAQPRDVPANPAMRRL